MLQCEACFAQRLFADACVHTTRRPTCVHTTRRPACVHTTRRPTCVHTTRRPTCVHVITTIAGFATRCTFTCHRVFDHKLALSCSNLQLRRGSAECVASSIHACVWARPEYKMVFALRIPLLVVLGSNVGLHSDIGFGHTRAPSLANADGCI
jgi:hypothetical protein